MKRIYSLVFLLSLAKHLGIWWFRFLDLKSHWYTWKNAFRCIYLQSSMHRAKSRQECASAFRALMTLFNTHTQTKIQLFICVRLSACVESSNHSSIEHEESDWVEEKNHTHIQANSYFLYFCSLFIKIYNETWNENFLPFSFFSACTQTNIFHHQYLDYIIEYIASCAFDRSVAVMSMHSRFFAKQQQQK